MNIQHRVIAARRGNFLAFAATFLLCLLSTLLPAIAHAQKSCLMESYIRVGTPWDACLPDRPVYEGGLCYKACPAGWNGVGHECYQPCPGGFRDDGLYCAKPPMQTSGGYVVWDEAKCKRENSQGCYKSGALWFPHCKDGYKRMSDQICAPACPGGFQDIGVSCKKPNQNRGVGIPKNMCSGGKERINFLCYEACRPGFKGTHHVCGTGQCPAGTEDRGGWCCAGKDCAPVNVPAQPDHKFLGSLVMPADIQPSNLPKCSELPKPEAYVGKLIKFGQSPTYYVNPKDRTKIIVDGNITAGCEIPPIETAQVVPGEIFHGFPNGPSLTRPGHNSAEDMIDRCRAARGLPMILRGGVQPQAPVRKPGG